VDSGQFVTGGGWVADAGSWNGKDNFGFNARFNKNNKPQGQMVFIWRGTYGGEAAVFRIKSNSLDSLGFSGTNYPLIATLQGKANLQITRASDGATLGGEGNLNFVAKARDTGTPSGQPGDQFSLTVTRGDNSIVKSFADVPLGGGNLVIHLK
jgi:hypothetical protein